MFVASQYYRPPFPNKKYWKDDLSLMRNCGLDGLQLWACWGWIEPAPGEYKFDDYDELVKEADKRGLKVVLSTIAEIHPFWIHRVFPDSQMVNHTGKRVASTLRGECNVGLTPGGCTDHPGVRESMRKFLVTIAKRYSNTANLIGWDAWNETRWCVNAEGLVCYCEYTLKAYRKWLEEKYGSLQGLNKAWKRRYSSWEDVVPGIEPTLPFVDLMEFQRFIVQRATEHMRFRYEAIKEGNPNHFVSAHCGAPCTVMDGNFTYKPLQRGNDWEHADQLDGYGASHFPFWQGYPDDNDYAFRVESIRSAAYGKPMWISELQGGRGNTGINANPQVPGEPQQRWIWNGFARGAKGIIFWCWRDEVFGRESSGFGFSGSDGMFASRRKAMLETSRCLQEHGKFLDSYLPDDPKVGVLFEPDNYMLNWADKGECLDARCGILGYAQALERQHIPYHLMEAAHAGILKKLKVLFMPWPLTVRPELTKKLQKFVRDGGTIVVEAELDSFDRLGFYQYPGPDRPFAHSLGLSDKGRRELNISSLEVSLEGAKFTLKPAGFLTPLQVEKGEVLAADAEGNVLLVRIPLGKGAVYAAGSFLGIVYEEKPYPDFEKFIQLIVESAKAMPEIKVESEKKKGTFQWRSGISQNKRLLFVLNAGSKRQVKVSVPPTLVYRETSIKELKSGKELSFKKEGSNYCFSDEIEAGEYAVYRWKK